jgi:acetyl-CoA carboxylase carboxyltransferase component
MTARERIDYLTEGLEIDRFRRRYVRRTRRLSHGAVIKSDMLWQQCIVVANDANCKSWLFPITGKKNLRAQEIAMKTDTHNLFGRFC